MLPHEQLTIGVVAGLTFCALLRWMPLLRDLLAATAVAGLIGLLINDQARHRSDLVSLTAGLPDEIFSHPHFCLGVAVAFTSVLALVHVFRSRA